MLTNRLILSVLALFGALLFPSSIGAQSMTTDPVGFPTTNPKEGHIYAVVSNSMNSLTVDTSQDNLVGIPANAQLLVIPNWTPATIFPASDANASFTPTTSSASYKTQLLIPDYAAPGI